MTCTHKETFFATHFRSINGYSEMCQLMTSEALGGVNWEVFLDVGKQWSFFFWWNGLCYKT